LQIKFEVITKTKRLTNISFSATAGNLKFNTYFYKVTFNVNNKIRYLRHFEFNENHRSAQEMLDKVRENMVLKCHNILF
jgi:hypothetical protein